MPDLLTYEVSNVLVRGKGLFGKQLERALEVVFLLPLTIEPITRERIALAGTLAAKYGLSVYDATYVALAIECDALLITANIKRQGRVRGCSVVDIKEWDLGSENSCKRASQQVE